MCQQRWSFRRGSSRGSVVDSELVGACKDAAVITGAAAVSSTDGAASAAVEKSMEPYNEKRRLQFSLPLTVKFIAVAVLLASASAFSVGCIARMVLLSKFGALSVAHRHTRDIAAARRLHSEARGAAAAAAAAAAAKSNKSYQLPAPTVIPGKDVPYTMYSSKTFRVEGSATSQTLHIDRRNAAAPATEVTSKVNEGLVNNLDYAQYEEDSDHGGNVSASFASGSSLFEEDEDEDELPHNDYSHNDDSDGLHLPAGQHLLVDIKDVDSAFLDSEERLATAMVELISESKLTLLSYHCHSLVPIGVSCAGVLLESHVAFHTWPKEGVITMDLFTCGGNPLIPVVPSIQKLFGVPREAGEDEDQQDIPEPTMLWSHKLRGFREGFAPGYDRDRNPLDQDLGRYVLGKLDFDVKEQLVSAKTEFQTVDVYDLMYPRTRSLESYHKSLSDDGSFESRFPEQFSPDRILFLDGVIQSTLYGDAPYHESIVHPAMITHPNPKRVAIIGGGEGATLREVLKHNTVEEAVMIEIDEGVVDLSREHLPQWQDCSSISHHEGAAEWCFDDERVNARFEDAMAYFIDHFTDDNDQEEAAYDIIVMDALDPNDDIEFAVELYTSDTYIRSLYNALTADGILVVQVGEVPTDKDPADETGRFINRSVMREKLAEVGFESIHIYEEAHSGFLAPWSTLVAFKDIATRENWYRNPAEVELQLQKRILKNKEGRSSLRYFDGATMSSFQLPPGSFEVIHCRQENVPKDCDTKWPSKTATMQATASMGYNATVEPNESAAYNPVLERHGMTSLHSREYSLDNIYGWKSALLN